MLERMIIFSEKINTKLFIFLFLILIGINSIAQDVKWGKPNDKEKIISVCDFDSSANAIILSESGYISLIGNLVYIKIYKKIKILKNEGIENANIRIPFFSKDKLESIKDIKAQTHNFTNNNVQTQEVSKSNIFVNQISEYYSEVRFTFPDVKVGSIIEYEYTLIKSNILFLDAWVFQHTLPTLYSELITNIPKSLHYKILVFGDNLNSKYNGIENTENKYTLENVVGYSRENFVFSYDDYVEKIQFQLVSYDKIDNNGVVIGVETIDFLNNWNKLAAELSENYSFYLDRKAKANEILESLTLQNLTNEEKVKNIYSHLFSTYKFNNLFSIQTKIDLSELLNKKIGNSAELNLLYCLLLNQAGIEAYPLLISTKENGKVVKNFPLLEQFNKLIVAIKINEEIRFSDIQNSSNNCFSIPYEDFNYYGFLIKQDKGIWVEMMNQKTSKEVSNVIVRFDSTVVSVQTKNNFNGYYADEIRMKIRQENEKQKNFNLILNTDLKIDSVIRGNLMDNYQEYNEIHFYSSEYTHDNKIYLNLNAYEWDNPFKQNERIFPIEFKYPYSKQLRYTITIPPGYIIKSVPEKVAIAIPNSVGKFVFLTSVNGNQISVLIQQEINFSFLPKEYFPFLKEFYNQLVMKINEPIVIEKL